MANLSKIKVLLREKKISLREFAREIGITEQGLQLLIKNNSTKVETLELIAAKLNVPVSTFFEETEIESEKVTMGRLLSIIESQQRTIERLSNMRKSVYNE
jgi:transcriptional regulator with XRE-family HTH domain